MITDHFKGLEFDSVSHTYSFNGKELESVTRHIKQYKQVFDKAYWSERKAKELGRTPSAILQEWEAKSELAMFRGTEVHRFAEAHLKGEVPEMPLEHVIFQKSFQFSRFWKTHGKLFDEFYPEIRVFDEELGIAGTVDFLGRTSAGWVLMDWKTNDKFKLVNQYDNLLHPFSTLEASDINYYSLQLSLYKKIIERNTGIKIFAMRIIHLSQDDWRSYTIKDLSEKI